VPKKNNMIQFISPVDGDMLMDFDGINKGLSLDIKVKFLAPPKSKLKVNNIAPKETKKEENKSLFEAIIRLDGYRNTISVVEEETSLKEEIVVYWLRDTKPKYRLSLDDNIWFLKDIAKNSNKYKSIFENPYLSVFKDANKIYGTKVHINLFYQTEGFNLSQMPDKFKSEWKDNANWLRLTFHSRQEFPDKPYINAKYDEIKKDYELITEEIIRFAGEELLSPITTVHWGETTLEAARALRAVGIKGLVGYFQLNENRLPIVSYYLNKEQTKHLEDRDMWKDNKEDIIFIKHDIVLDKTELSDICPFLEKIKKKPRHGGIIELLIHEQYFYPNYKDFQPEYKEKVLTAVKWAKDNNYEPAFWKDVVLEKQI
jgi:hypothetical protein